MASVEQNLPLEFYHLFSCFADRPIWAFVTVSRKARFYLFDEKKTDHPGFNQRTWKREMNTHSEMCYNSLFHYMTDRIHLHILWTPKMPLHTIYSPVITEELKQ